MLRSIILLISLFVSGFSYASENVVNGFSEIVEPLMPTVVNVYTVQYPKTSPQSQMNNPFRGLPDQFSKFFENFDFPMGFDEMYSNPKAMALGSGVIISPEGYIITNHHVIANADEINVKLSDDKELSAKVIGSDERTDIALLKVENKSPLPYAKFGDSDKAKVGDWIIAIGNPFGLGGTVTAGIISSKGRDIQADSLGIVDNFIQTDAAINSGNSGGPMFNMAGEVIGINSAIFSPSGSNIGIGFAIPSSTAQKVMEQLKKYGKISRGFLGIKIKEMTPEMADAMNIGDVYGVVIMEVDKDGVAAKSGLKPGDIIVKFGDVEVTNSRKLQIAVADTPVNTEVKIVILREGVKKEFSCKITETTSSRSLAQGKSNKESDSYNGETFETHGVVFGSLKSDFSDSEGGASGVVVMQIKQGANWRGLAKGDMVLSINQKPINSLKEFKDTFDSAVKNQKKHVVLFVRRGNSNVFLALPI